MYLLALPLEIAFTALGCNGLTRFDKLFALDNVAYFELGIKCSIIRVHAYALSHGKATVRPNFQAGELNM